MASIKNKGFTLVELIIVIVLLGIVSITIGSLYSYSISSYMTLLDSISIVDDADAVQRRFFRDIRKSLPNSVRIKTLGTKTFLEFIPVRTSGKYKSLANSTASANACAADDSAEVDNDILSVGKADTCLKTIGTLIDTSTVSASDYLVIYNTGGGDSNTDAYVGGNRTTLSSATDLTNETKLVFSSKTFSYGGTGDRFFVVMQPVTYECDTSTHTLKRYTNYGFNSVQATSYTGGSILSKNMNSCVWTYSNLLNTQKGLVTFKLGLTSGSRSAMLVNSASIGNAP